MGLFLAVSAVSCDSASKVAGVIAEHASRNGVAWSKAPPDQVNEESDAAIHASMGGWVVIVWPNYFTQDASLAETLSRGLGTVASTVHVYDGDYWSHLLFDSGRLIDRFASDPDYFAESREDRERLQREWRGDPRLVAAAVGVQPETLARYLEGEQASGKAYTDDEFDLDDVWVFVDFWRRMGIAYPSDSARPEHVIRLMPGWEKRLPSGDYEL